MIISVCRYTTLRCETGRRSVRENVERNDESTKESERGAIARAPSSSHHPQARSVQRLGLAQQIAELPLVVVDHLLLGVGLVARTLDEARADAGVRQGVEHDDRPHRQAEAAA